MKIVCKDYLTAGNDRNWRGSEESPCEMNLSGTGIAKAEAKLSEPARKQKLLEQTEQQKPNKSNSREPPFESAKSDCLCCAE